MGRGAWQAIIRGVEKSWTQLKSTGSQRFGQNGSDSAHMHALETDKQQDLLYRTGDSAQYSVVTCVGKESGKE